MVFLDVIGMKLASAYKKLAVEAAIDSLEMDEFLQGPDRYGRGFVNFWVSDDARKGFVVCKRVTVRRGVGWQDSGVHD
ncbi:hypothetical protein ADL03_13640 [Nocardia sp. NRRL S-836]|nr:hypothetical protein ADL03_13640 [Nocardia sp. NRRL S-836]